MSWPAAAVTLSLSVALASPAALASDHRDAAATIAVPETDLNDLYAWVSPDKKTTYLIMTVFPLAGAPARFANAALYVFHTSSRAKFTDPLSRAVPADIICRFDAAQRIECWGGGDYVAGDASSPGGVASRSGRLRVFAGLREDPFFFNLDGFGAFRSSLKGHVTGGQISTFDANGCPLIPAALRPQLNAQLRERPGSPGAPAMNAFASRATLAIVVSVDTALLSTGGPIVAVWAGTHDLASGGSQ